MKLDVRLQDDGAPIIFFLDQWEPHNPSRITCYAHAGQHAEAARAYMRQCKKPVEPEEIERCCRLLTQWAKIPL